MTTSPPSVPPRPARSHRLRVVSVGVGIVALTLLTACQGADQSNALKLVRNDRARYGVRTIAVDSATQGAAQSHASAMARSGRLFHSSLTMARNQCAKGENVGVGSSITQVEQLFMRSSAHRGNILNSRYDHIGIGVVRSGGRVWVVEQFVDIC